MRKLIINESKSVSITYIYPLVDPLFKDYDFKYLADDILRIVKEFSVLYSITIAMSADYFNYKTGRIESLIQKTIEGNPNKITTWFSITFNPRKRTKSKGKYMYFGRFTLSFSNCWGISYKLIEKSINNIPRTIKSILEKLYEEKAFDSCIPFLSSLPQTINFTIDD